MIKCWIRRRCGGRIERNSIPHSQSRIQRTTASSTRTGHVYPSGKKSDNLSFRPTCSGSIDLAMQPVDDKSSRRASPSKSSSPKKKRRQFTPTRRDLRASFVEDTGVSLSICPGQSLCRTGSLFPTGRHLMQRAIPEQRPSEVLRLVSDLSLPKAASRNSTASRLIVTRTRRAGPCRRGSREFSLPPSRQPR